MQAVISRLFLPLVVIGISGLILSGVWLAIIGEWWALVAGLLWLLASSFVIAFLLMPGLAFERPAIHFLQGGRSVLAAIMVLFAQFYTSLLTVVWCLFVFCFFMTDASDSSFLPLFIWSYGVALCPYMAHLDRHAEDGDPAVYTTFLAQFAYIAMGLVGAWLEHTLFEAMTVFVVAMAAGFVLQTIYAFVLLQAEVKANRAGGSIAS